MMGHTALNTYQPRRRIRSSRKMSRSYSILWTVKYPDGYLSAFDCLALFPHEARKKAVKRWKKPWPVLRKQGFECVEVIFKQVKK